MREWYWNARAHVASGRFLFLVALALPLLASGCKTVGGGTGGTSAPSGEGAGLAPVVVEPGPISRSDQAAAEQLMAEAVRSFEARRFFEALRTADEVLTRSAHPFPSFRRIG